MADKQISQLPAATQINDTDLLVMQQDSTAKKLPGSVFNEHIDTKTATTRAAIAPTEASTTASQAYAIGERFWLNGTLYIATAAIASGGTIVTSGSGANCKVDVLGDDVSDLKSALTDVTDIAYNAYITDTATGAIASFDDGADGVPVKSLVVNVDPVQDLHGYDNPWPAGGGKNLLAVTLSSLKSSNTDGTWTGNDYVRNGITFKVDADESGNVFRITANGTASATALLFFNSAFEIADERSYIWSGITGGSNSTYYFQCYWRNSGGSSVANQVITNGDNTITVDYADNAVKINTFLIGVNSGTQLSNVEFKPMLRLSTVSDNTFAPYSNICPISGHTEANVTRTGKNLWSLADSYTSTSANQWVLTDTAMPLKAGTYTISLDSNVVGNGSAAFNFKSRDSQTTSVVLSMPGPDTHITKTFSINDNSMAALCLYGDARTVSNIQLELGSTATDYEPYSGNTYDITFPASAGTVYGGTLDVTTGVLTVDRVFVELDGNTPIIYSNSGSASEPAQPYWCSFFIYGSSNCTNDYSKWKFSSGLVTYSAIDSINRVCKNGQVFFVLGTPSQLDTAQKIKDYVQEFATAGNPFQVVYTIDTPITYQLTPTEVKTLLGTNNIWADTGDIDVDYCADTKLYIEQLTQPSEDDMTANANIAANKFFMIGNTLYYSITSITAGEEIVVGTNANVVSLADALNTINS